MITVMIFVMAYVHASCLISLTAVMLELLIWENGISLERKGAACDGKSCIKMTWTKCTNKKGGIFYKISQWSMAFLLVK